MTKFVFSIFLTFFVFSTLSQQEISAASNKRLAVYETGLYQSASSESKNLSAKEVEITTVEGQNVKGDFDVTENFFKGNFQFESELYNLEGKKIKNQGMNYFEFKGTVNNKKNQEFEAYVERKGTKYIVTLNILIYAANNQSELKDAKTFIFDGNNKPLISKQMKNVNYTERNFNNSFSTDEIKKMGQYYEILTIYYGTYMDSMVQGSRKMAKGQSDYHSLRNTTDSNAINKYWNDSPYYSDARETTVINYWVNISTSKAAAFTPIEPLSSSKTSFNVPVWLGNTLGIQNIPVTVSSVSISGQATANLKLTFNWSSGYLDNSNITSTKPSKGYGVRYEFDTSYNIGTGYAGITSTPKMKYRTKVKSVYSWYWVYKETSNNANYSIYIY